MTSAREGRLDRLIDRSLVLGYSDIGRRIRQRTWPADPASDALLGKRALVTGAASGLGEAAARGLLALGATVHVAGRSLQRISPTVASLNAEASRHGWSGVAVAAACDVADLSDVRRFAADLLEELNGAALDAVIHNAGVMPAERTESVDGHELTVATHLLGPVLMTELLRPALAASTHPARVVFVSSGGMYAQPLPAHDPEFRHGRYGGATAYARSKRMQVELTPELARRWGEDGITVVTMHPGWADTPGVATSLPLFRTLTKAVLRDAEAGADTMVWLAAVQPPPETGRFWHDRAIRPTHYLGRTRPSTAEVEQMWEWTREALPELG